MKFKKRKKQYKALNLPPGTLSYKGKKQSNVTHIEVFQYNSETCNKYNFKNVAEVFDLKDSNYKLWININGLNDLKAIEEIGSNFNIHALTLEDILNPMHRPKIDEFENYLFIVFKMLYFSSDDNIIYENVSMVVAKDYVLTFQESDGDVFDDLRGRILNIKGRIRNLGTDYLMYAILDAIVDNYLNVVEAFGVKIEDLEVHIFDTESNDKETPNHIQTIKQEILKIRRSIFPFREVVNRLDKIEIDILDPKTHRYLRDLYDHIVHVSESVDLYREMVWSLMEMYMTIISNKMNEVMKVLTIIATIFIPLTFMAGVYGMNFDNIPELHYEYGYYILWGIMAIIFILMLLYFRRKKWL